MDGGGNSVAASVRFEELVALERELEMPAWTLSNSRSRYAGCRAKLLPTQSARFWEVACECLAAGRPANEQEPSRLGRLRKCASLAPLVPWTEQMSFGKKRDEYIAPRRKCLQLLQNTSRRLTSPCVPHPLCDLFPSQKVVPRRFLLFCAYRL
jgi:hypothetical protein